METIERNRRETAMQKEVDTINRPGRIIIGLLTIALAVPVAATIICLTWGLALMSLHWMLSWIG